MADMRAKMLITKVEAYPADGPASHETLHMCAVSKSEAYPDDGSDEDNTYAKFSPSTSLQLTIANPALLGKFAAGEKYYLDFTKAE